ncbi:MAG: APC family permease [Actinomycetota bacterium]
MPKIQQAVKRIFLGRPMSSGELEHTLLPKKIALPVFSSDPLSSNAYATQEALIVLAAAGAVGMSLILPIALAVAGLLWIVVTSYRQTVRAYPAGGGAYRVSRENLGTKAGLFAGSALLIDYCMTVAVSITAGVEALSSLSEGLYEHRVPLALSFVVLVTIVNLRGAKESGTLFAIPTYGFVISIYLMIGTGLVKCLGGCPQAETATQHLEVTATLSFFLILRAFAAGTTALTGVEAIADGVPAFRYPQSKNAAMTLTIMATLSSTMFIGISWLADHTNVVYLEDAEGQRSVLAQVADTVFNGGPMFLVIQLMSAAILILAANTAYQDFPRLASILATDRFLPGQFRNRGDRLVFSNGVIILAIAASTVIYIFDANLTRLIQLYLVGCFISFTLSQSGMFIRTRKLKEPGWQRRSTISGFGAIVTGTVLVVIAGSKFTHGAWIVLTAIPLLMTAMHAIYKHYKTVQDELGHPERYPQPRRAGQHHMVIYVEQLDAAAARAVGYARSVRPSSITAVTRNKTRAAAWMRLAPEVPITTLEGSGNTPALLRGYLRARRVDMNPEDFLTILVPEILQSTGLFEIIRRPRLHNLKRNLIREPGVQVLDVPIVAGQIDPTADEAHEPGRNIAVVLVGTVNNAARQAIYYAETLRPTDIKALSFGLEADPEHDLASEWVDSGIDHPLELQDSPFRDIATSLTTYVRRLAPDGVNKIVTVVLPEFVVEKNRHQILHNQTALLIKRQMLFETGVVVASVPYHLYST